MISHNTFRCTVQLLCTAAVIAATGCSVSPTASVTATPPVTTSAGKTLQGRVHGGQQPVDLATIQLYAVSKTGYGNASSALISSTVQTNATGDFSIANDYTCQPSDLLYIVATGGNPGVPGTQNNSSLAMMTGIGRCDSLNSSTFIQINELTTVASIWALAPFMTDMTHVATSATNVQGLANAFSVIDELINTQTGALSGTALPAGATLPINEINTLADILAVCVNSVDLPGPTESSQCNSIFTAATPSTTAPTNTIQAALNLAQNPTLALTLSSMATGTAPYQPTLGAAPTSWTLAINYIGGGLNAPTAIAADAGGNIWVANTNNSVTKLDPTGAALSGTSGFTAGSMSSPSAIAIDAGGNAWIANSGNSSVTFLSSTGATGVAHSGGGLSTPKGIAIDAAGNVWVANSGNSSVTELSSSGTAISGANGFAAGGVNQPSAIAIDPK